MADVVVQMAQSSCCLMSVFPVDRVSWLAPLRSTTPRNFLQHPMTWSTLLKKFNANGAGDFTIEMEFGYDSFESTNSYALNLVGSPSYLQLKLNKTSIYYYFLGFRFTDGTTGYVDLLTNPVEGERHNIRIVYSQAETISMVYFDGALKKSVAGTLDFSTGSICLSNHNGTISQFRVATSKNRWQADYFELYEANNPWPQLSANSGSTTGTSFAEKTGLVTLENIRSDQDVFEGMTAGVARRIKTRLDLRGNSKSLTLVSRAFIPSHSADGKLYASGLITQGMFTSGPASQVAAMSVWEDHRQTPGTLRLYTTASTSGNTEQGTSYVIPVTTLDKWTTFAGVYNFELGTVTGYVDGAAVGTVNRGTLTAFGQGANSDLSDAVSILHDLNSSVLGMSDHKISWAMVFDRALTAAEIAALCPASTNENQ